jgi:hypothetical protein
MVQFGQDVLLPALRIVGYGGFRCFVLGFAKTEVVKLS